jgi:hypothetical protein
MMLPEPPEGWGNDEVTAFFDALRCNEYATFANCQPQFQTLIAIDSAYRTLAASLTNSKDWFAAFFLLRAHSNLLAGMRLCASGQLPETYACLRSCVENALYGLYLAKIPESRETWLRRHDSDDHKKKVRDEFRIRTMLNLLASIDAREAQVAETLYDRTIDYGAHPNERALMQTLQLEKEPGTVEFKVVYAGGNSHQFQLALKTAAQVGVSGLSVFRLVYKERFDIVGLTQTLDALKVGL